MQLIHLLPNALYASHESPITPLHLAILSPLGVLNGYNKQECIVELLLAADVTAGKASLFDTFQLLNADNSFLGNFTPLHLVISCISSTEILMALVDADSTGNKEKKIVKKSLVEPIRPDEKCYPLLAATQNNLPDFAIRVLVDADWSKDGLKTRINVLPSFRSGELLERFVPIIINETALSYLLYPDCMILPETEDFEIKGCIIPNKYMPELAANPTMQRYLNEFLFVTYAFAYLLLFDFYVHVVSILCFMLHMENENISMVWFTTRYLLYSTASLILAREIIEMIFFGLIQWTKSPVHTGLK